MTNLIDALVEDPSSVQMIRATRSTAKLDWGIPKKDQPVSTSTQGYVCIYSIKTEKGFEYHLAFNWNDNKRTHILYLGEGFDDQSHKTEDIDPSQVRGNCDAAHRKADRLASSLGRDVTPIVNYLSFIQGN